MLARRLPPRPFAAAMIAGAVLLVASIPARAQDTHGAIAFGHITQDQAVTYGFAWDFPSGDQAQEAAMDACLNSGGSDCPVLAWFQNSCGALAMDQYGMAQGKGARTKKQAETRALATCETAGGVGCAVVGSQCGSPGGEPDTWSGSERVLAAPGEESGQTAEAAQTTPDVARPFDVSTGSITAIVPGTYFSTWDGHDLNFREAPQIPDAGKDYDDIVECKEGHVPLVAWAEVHTSWPSVDVMYSVNTKIQNEKVVVGLRSRQGFPRGYAYIDITALCVIQSWIR